MSSPKSASCSRSSALSSASPCSLHDNDERAIVTIQDLGHRIDLVVWGKDGRELVRTTLSPREALDKGIALITSARRHVLRSPI